MEKDTDNLMTEPETEVSLKLKYFLLAFSMFFWLIGALFAAVGGYVTSQKNWF